MRHTKFGYKANGKRLYECIGKNKEIMEKLGWENKTRFIKIHNGYFSMEETEILIQFFKLME